jgi:ABC transporter transmembrane region
VSVHQQKSEELSSTPACSPRASSQPHHQFHRPSIIIIMLDPMYGNMASPDYSNDPLRRSDMVGSGSNKKTVKTTTTTTTTRDGASTTPNATSDIAKNGNGDIIQKAPTKDESLASSISAIHGDGNNNNNNNHKKNANANAELATVTQVFSFCQTTRCRCFLALAFLCAMISGACMPALAFYFATAFEKLAGSVINNTSSGGGEDSDTSDAAFMQTIRQVAFSFMALGAIVFTSMTCQAMLMETVANEMTIALQTSWFRALLRQDMTYHDIQNNGTGEASIVHTNGAAFKKGVGRKLAEAVQFTTTFIASLAYSFYASWQTTLAVLAISPIMFLSMLFLVNLSTTQTKRANASYSRAGSIVATAISAIRTILALNATDTVLLQYQSATADARRGAIRQVWLYGLANGGQMASMLLSYMIIVTFGTWLLYNQTRENGCDPSGTIVDNEICNPSAVDVFGSLMAVGYVFIVDVDVVVLVPVESSDVVSSISNSLFTE